MMKLKTTSLLGFGLVFLLSGTLWCQNTKVYNDVIFVIQPGKEGVYSKKTGNIVTLTPSIIIMETEGLSFLYTPEAVKRIELDKIREDDNKELVDTAEFIKETIRNWPKMVFELIWEEKEYVEDFQDNVDYWNKKKSQIVLTVQKTPGIGPALSFLDNFPGAKGTFLAVLILIAILSFGVYRLYQMLVVTSNLRHLNRTKLNMEIRKLHFDIESIKKKLGLTEKMAPSKIQTQKIEKEPILPSFKIPEVHLLNFIKFKILRILTEEERQRRTELWRKKWQAYKDKPAWQRVLFNYTRLSMNLLATILVAIFSMGSFVDIFLPFIDPEIPAGPFISLIFLVIFVVLFAYLLRLNTQRRIMRKTYRESRT